MIKGPWSDESWPKFFDPGLGRVSGSGIFPPKIFNTLPSGQKNLTGLGQKFSGQRQFGHLFTASHK